MSGIIRPAQQGRYAIHWPGILLLVVLLFLVVPVAQVQAQQLSSAEQLKTRKSAAISAIEAAALARGPVHSTIHTAVLREALPLLGAIGQGLSDFDAPRHLQTVLARVSVLPVDEDSGFKKRQMHFYKQARRDIDPQSAGNVDIRVVGSAVIRNPGFPGVVAIRDGGDRVCTGVYFNPGKVLTAAHCVCDMNLAQPGPFHRVIFGDHFENGGFLNGSLITRSVKASGTSIFPRTAGQESDFCKIRVRDSLPAAGIDLALITIDATTLPAFPATRLAAAEDLASTLADNDEDIRPFFIAGFGKSYTENNGQLELTISGEKRGAPVLSGMPCPPSGTFGGAGNRCLPGREVAAFDTSGRDSCNGDSGGPLFVRNPSTSRWLLAAVTSRGMRFGHGCGQGGVYTLVFAQDIKNWMTANGVVFEP